MGDGSNSQFALLGLHEARLAGIGIDETVWQNARSYWNGLRAGDGSYYYARTSSIGFTPTGSMTAAGISSMIIIDENLKGSDMVTAGGEINCCTEKQNWCLQQVFSRGDFSLDRLPVQFHFPVFFQCPRQEMNTFTMSVPVIAQNQT